MNYGVFMQLSNCFSNIPKFSSRLKKKQLTHTVYDYQTYTLQSIKVGTYSLFILYSYIFLHIIHILYKDTVFPDSHSVSIVILKTTGAEGLAGQVQYRYSVASEADGGYVCPGSHHAHDAILRPIWITIDW